MKLTNEHLQILRHCDTDDGRGVPARLIEAIIGWERLSSSGMIERQRVIGANADTYKLTPAGFALLAAIETNGVVIGQVQQSVDWVSRHSVGLKMPKDPDVRDADQAKLAGLERRLNKLENKSGV